MGCNCSTPFNRHDVIQEQYCDEEGDQTLKRQQKIEEQQLILNQKLEKNRQKQKISNELTSEQQEELQELIESGQTKELLNKIQLHKIGADQDIGADGYGETFEGYTPHYLCCLDDSSEALSVLLNLGGIDLTKVSSVQKCTLRGFADKNFSSNCIQLLKQYEMKAYPINDDFFKVEPPYTDEIDSWKEETQDTDINKQQVELDYQEQSGSQDYLFEETQIETEESRNKAKKHRIDNDSEYQSILMGFNFQINQFLMEITNINNNNQGGQRQQEMDEYQERIRKMEQNQEDYENQGGEGEGEADVDYEAEEKLRQQELRRKQMEQEQKRKILEYQNQLQKRKEQAEREEARQQELQRKAQELQQKKKEQEQRRIKEIEIKMKLEQEERQKQREIVGQVGQGGGGGGTPIFPTNQTNEQNQYAFYSILNQLEQMNSAFVDQQFPHTCRSITGQDQYPSNVQYDRPLWLRPHDYLKVNYDKINLFQNGIDPNDIQQGGLGVCYFLCVLSSLAETPNRVQKLFVPQNSNRFGVYSALIYIDGKLTEVIIDDFIPCDINSKRPLFSKLRGQEIWALLLEKAWSKTFTYYLRANGGCPNMAMEELTGCPSIIINFEEDETNHDELFQKIMSWEKQGYIFGISSKEGEQQNQMGLVANHAYTLLSAYDVAGVKILKIRNPWGRTEFKGKYGDQGEGWTEELKAAVKFEQVDDGIFFMDLEELYFGFSELSVGFIRDTYSFYSIPVSLNDQEDRFFRFTLDRDGEICIRLHQKYIKRVFNEQYAYSRGIIDLYKIDNDGMATLCLKGNGWNAQSVTLSQYKQPPLINLKAGNYVVHVNWTLTNNGEIPQSKQYNLSTYFITRTLIYELNGSEVQDFQKSQELGTAKGIALKPNKNFPDVKQGGGWDSKNNFFFVFDNKRPEQMNISIDLCDSTGISFKGNVRQLKSFIEASSFQYFIAENQGGVNLKYIISMSRA